MGDMEFIDMKALFKKMIDGEIQINRPLLLTSKDRTETEKISFLSHLLKYNDITKENIFSLLNEAMEVFNKRIETFMKNPNFADFVKSVVEEWGLVELTLYSNDKTLNGKISMIEELLENINELCHNFREVNSRIESNNITDVIENDELVESMNAFLKGIEDITKHFEELNRITDDLMNNIDKVSLQLLLDLSMKDKQLYLELNDIDNDNNINENIHNVFLNYAYILNLIRKHVIYYKSIIKKVRDITQNMSTFIVESKFRIKKTDRVFNLNQQQEEIDKYLTDLQSETF